ncbi:Lrp/AsnC ligand binding domain-containing protein [Thermococcus pacificus]|uniref:AsnC family transcriptional regulator n=1 Tax=Thermococcus pacificus TaxID=71998 RepID=A0A218P740_9EURY|nr:Lrp/AsnC ligand binding domain-containing protein [Thermococcus pacificus]ASJ06605.1 AsnC family transcriptional regulator [Thermococcus pacificus]
MMEVFVLVVVKPGHEEEVYNALSGHERIKEIYRVYGEYDLILRVEVENVEALDRFHDEVLRKLKNIEMTETLIASSYRG